VDKTYQLLLGDAQDVLKQFPDNTFHTIVTSPPYWQLRDYFVEGQLGHEGTPEAYVQKLVDIFREIKRVLRNDGTVWLVIGDSSSTPKKGNTQGAVVNSDRRRNKLHQQSIDKKLPPKMKTKNKIGIPWRLALALQDDGWFLRQDIIWQKRNAMPDGAKDRPSTSHEYIFLLTKSARYFYDYYAVLETASKKKPSKRKFGANNQKGTYRQDQDRYFSDIGKRNKRSVWTTSIGNNRSGHFACVDEKTECLTKVGWKKYYELSVGEEIAVYDLDKQATKWDTLKDVHVYDYNDELIEITKPTLNFLFTPNHRMLYKSLDIDELRIRRADELSKNDKLLVSSNWIKDNVKSKYSPSFCELLGWISSEGHYRKTGEVNIYQSVTKNSIKVDRIASLLDECSIPYKKYIRTRIYKGKPNISATFVIKNSAAKTIREIMPHKKPTKEFISWAIVDIKNFINGFIGGDGHIRPDDGRKSIIQKDVEVMDILQALVFRLGYMPLLRKRKSQNCSTLFLTNKKLVGVKLNKSRNSKAIKKTKYNGKVWCPSTNATTFVARRNGNIIITGNTFPVELITPCIAAGTSEKGCCSQCGAPWKRVVQKYVHIKWVPTCKCGIEETKPCIVLDPFCGTSTTGVVALEHGCDYVGIDLNQDYINRSRERLEQIEPIFAEEKELCGKN